jgi:cholesterol transport system auxiliary component
MRRARPLLPLPLAALAACVSLPQAERVESFRLGASAPPPAVTREAAQPVAVALEQPIAQGALASDRIVVEVDGRLQVVSGARWDERAPEMLNRLMARALQASGGVDVVDGAQRAGRADFALVTVLERMQVAIREDYTGEARTEIAARLVRLPGREIVSTALFAGTAPAAADDPATLTTAIDDATASAVADLVAWVGGEVRRGRRG